MIERIFYNVDTQHDFMDKKGKLYVPNAEAIKPNLAKLTRYARDCGITIIGSVDAHTSKDPELKENKGPFPRHCMIGTFGQKHIPETKPINPIFVQNVRLSDYELDKILKHDGEIYFEKQHYDVFTNPNIYIILKIINPKEAVVYGVATDYCVKAAALGFRKKGIDVYLVEDAIEAVNVNQGDGNKALKEMEKAKVQFISVGGILK